jgi:hypothetical protein
LGQAKGRNLILLWRGLGATFALALFALLTSEVYADQGSFTNSGGTTSAGAGVTITSSPTTPSGTLSFNCPKTSVAICSGRGKSGHVTCSWGFTGYYGGTWTLNGVAEGSLA